MDTRASKWFTTNTWHDPDWTVEELERARGDQRVSVVLPALNEESTVGGVVSTVVPLLGRIVDEIVVMDSGSSDATAQVAAAAGARVVHRHEVLPNIAVLGGKGEVLWRALAVTTGDIVVYMDSDLVEPDPRFVPGLIGPLLFRPEIQMIKGFYRRPLRLRTGHEDEGGGRVTELLARPLLAKLWPELSGIVQPLGGEYAGRREFLETVEFAGGYGVEIGLLIDTYEKYGLEGLGQVNLGVRKHRNRTLLELGVTACHVAGSMLERCGLPVSSEDITQFVQVHGTWTPQSTATPTTSRPPMREVS